MDGDRFRFVDGLSGLFDGSLQTQQQQQGTVRSGPAMGTGRSIPLRGPASPRAPPVISSSAAVIPPQAKSSTPQQQHKQLHISGQGITALNQLENDILSVIQSLPKPTTHEPDEDEGEEDDILLILDQPDLILATTSGIDANDISEWVLGLQQVRPFPPLRVYTY